ncbi:MAG: methionine adenosyltransferase [Desulfatiglandaceae bacterium]
MKNDFVFTSESVTDGHPDKMCDQISDAIVDHFLVQDPGARIRAECAVSNAIVFIAAHFATSAKLDLPHVARKMIKKIGYDQESFNAKTCSILTAPQGLPPDKRAQFDEFSMTERQISRIAPETQATSFGFACDQTESLMPLPIWLANKLAQRLSHVRKAEILPYLAPDGKVQVGVAYKDRTPYRIHSVTLTASQRSKYRPALKTLRKDLHELVVEPVFDEGPIALDAKTKIFVNPAGILTGGPVQHSGLTGRKNAVDTYGEYARHSGNALSGKDPMRIDRVAAYAARYAAKNVVAAGLASECELTLSYSIGVSKPVGIQVRTRDTTKVNETKLYEIIREEFDFRLAAILRQFNLRHLPRLHPTGYYANIAAFGQVGRDDMDLPWEKTDKAEALASI